MICISRLIELLAVEQGGELCRPVSISSPSPGSTIRNERTRCGVIVKFAFVQLPKVSSGHAVMRSSDEDLYSLEKWPRDERRT